MTKFKQILCACLLFLFVNNAQAMFVLRCANRVCTTQLGYVPLKYSQNYSGQVYNVSHFAEGDKRAGEANLEMFSPKEAKGNELETPVCITNQWQKAAVDDYHRLLEQYLKATDNFEKARSHTHFVDFIAAKWSFDIQTARGTEAYVFNNWLNPSQQIIILGLLPGRPDHLIMKDPGESIGTKSLSLLEDNDTEIYSPLCEGDDEIFHFNIGGYEANITRRYIEQFAGPYLNKLIGNKVDVKDNREQILIDRPAEDGELLFHFLRTQTLPANVEEKVARRTAGYFMLTPMLNMINKRWPLMSEPKILSKINEYVYCEFCGVKNHDQHHWFEDLESTMEHLIFKHGAEIYHWNDYGNKVWKIFYRIPLGYPPPTCG